jgi:hypothetical protein
MKHTLRTRTPRGARELAFLLSDRRLTWGLRLAHLQGWRGSDATQAAAAQRAQRLAPALCAVGAIVGAALASPFVLALFAATAVIGAVADHHPFEVAYNAAARKLELPVLPANRAAHKLGCVMGIAFLGGAAVAFGLGAVTVGVILAGTMGATGIFVAISGICVPSMMFTLVLGADRGTCHGFTGGSCVAAHSTR